MKTSNEQFKKFKIYCEFYKEKYALNNWTIYYQHKDIKNGYASQSNGLYVATITFGKEWPDAEYDDSFIEDTARHEILHIITARLHQVAKERYTTRENLQDADELAVKLIENILGPINE